jgi:hypothetical protein
MAQYVSVGNADDAFFTEKKDQHDDSGADQKIFTVFLLPLNDYY